jgi:hypothetical protein
MLEFLKANTISIIILSVVFLILYISYLKREINKLKTFFIFDVAYNRCLIYANKYNQKLITQDDFLHFLNRVAPVGLKENEPPPIFYILSYANIKISDLKSFMDRYEPSNDNYIIFDSYKKFLNMTKRSELIS